MRLLDVYTTANSPETLYRLLAERTPDESISHREMPGWSSHLAFVNSKPYPAWYLIEEDGEIVGSVYLGYANEIGIFIFSEYQGMGYGKRAVLLLMRKHGPRTYQANVNPRNERSARLFHDLGFKVIQHTYEKTA